MVMDASASMEGPMGMGTAGQEDNTVQFEIHPTAPETTADQLQALCDQLLLHAFPLIDGYIWQKDRFALHSSLAGTAPWHRPGPAAALPPHLWGAVHFGDNIDDEWFIVWLLLELTRAFPVTARAWDNDGEFILIEAAYSLPRWLKPERAVNRLWAHGGCLHLVPLPHRGSAPALPAELTVAQALAAVRGHSVDTAAAARAIQQACQPRLHGFPGRARALMHRTHVLLPARLAHVLHREPQLVAAAAEAFHYRDPSDVRAAARMAAFPPTDMVLASVVFSRCLYAQVALQQYQPPKGWPPLPEPSHPAFAAAELGAKVTAGFEMVLASEPRNGGAAAQQAQHGAVMSASTGQLSDAELARDGSFQAYRRRLEALGYFKGQLPGSVAYTTALQRGMDEFRRTHGYQLASAALASPAHRIRQLVTEEMDVPVLAACAEALPPADSEAWLGEGPARLEAELAQREKQVEEYQQRRAGKRGAAGREGGAASADFDPSHLSARFQEFMTAASGLDGAEAPPEGVTFDERRFAAELQRVLGLTGAVGGGSDAYGSGSGSDDGDVSTHSSEEGSSFFSGSGTGSDDSDSESEQATPLHPALAARATAAGLVRREDVWETLTATDSDDDGAFMEGYGLALDQQLAATAMGRSFQQMDVARGVAVEEAQLGEQEQDGDEAGVALRPVDLDVNLVSSLLASYREQGGLPGPASNLAGLLGVKLPDPKALK